MALRKSPLPRWIGSKRLALKQILPLIPPHELYCELFCGAAWVGFNVHGVASPARRILNDADPEVINAYEVLRDRPLELTRLLHYSVSSRIILHEVAAGHDRTPLGRAYRFFYINKAGFSARMRTPSYAIRRTVPKSVYSFNSFARRLLACAAFLPDYEFANLDFRAAIKEYDSPGTFFYADPPYPGCERYYEPSLYEETALKDLARLLREIKGRALISLPDSAGIRDLFAGFSFRGREVLYNINNRKPARAAELLIANYKFPETA